MKSPDPFRAQLVVDQLGAIEHAELTIRPLTLFFGPNGTNKTWTAYALYGLLRRFHMGDGRLEDVPHAWRANVEAMVRESRESSDGHLAATGGSVDLIRPDRANALETHDLCKLLALDPSEMSSGHASLRIPARIGLRDGATIEVHISSDPGEIGVLSMSSDSKTMSAAMTLGPDTDGTYFLTRIWAETTALTESVRAFPAERKALLTLHHQLTTLSTVGPSVTAKSLGDGLRSSLVATRLKDAAASMESALPVPSVDFITHIDREWHRRPDTPPGPMADIAAALEGILGGRLEFAVNALGGRSPLLRFKSESVDLPIHSTHSLARSLGGLDLYLRESAMPGDFVFIDEPEMNAHPETQVAIAEIIALMVNSGLRVVATTHSPYIVDHLHNLIEAERLDAEGQARFAEYFKLNTSDAFIAADQVAAYHFDRDGIVTDAFDRAERVIDWSLLGDDADAIANLYSELLGAQRDG